MLIFSQQSPEWAHKTIGNTQFTIGRWGCTITSICMLISKLHPSVKITPPEAANKWAFNSNAEILWRACNFEFLEFGMRGYGYNKAVIDEYADSEVGGVILEVNHSHWIAVQKTNEKGGYVIHDPIDGKVYSELPARYRITGYATFDKVHKELEVPDWFKPAMEAAQRKGITKFENLHKEITAKKLEWIMHDLGFRDKVDGNYTEMHLLMSLYKAGLLD